VARILDGLRATRAITSRVILRFVYPLTHPVAGKAGLDGKQPLVLRPGNTPDCMMADSEPNVWMSPPKRLKVRTGLARVCSTPTYTSWTRNGQRLR